MKQNTQHWISGLTSFFISTPKDGYFHFIWVFIKNYSFLHSDIYRNSEWDTFTACLVEKCLNINKNFQGRFQTSKLFGQKSLGAKTLLVQLNSMERNQ